MGVYRGRGAEIDFIGIKAEMAPTVYRWFPAYVVLINPGPNQIYLKDKNNAAFIWDGMARVQPYRREVATATTTNPTTNQSVRFQIDFNVDGVIPDIKTDWQIAVLPESLSGVALNDPMMPRYQHVVRSAMNSSQAWIRTVECQVNTEVTVNYGTAIVGSPLMGFAWA